MLTHDDGPITSSAPSPPAAARTTAGGSVRATEPIASTIGGGQRATRLPPGRTFDDPASWTAIAPSPPHHPAEPPDPRRHPPAPSPGPDGRSPGRVLWFSTGPSAAAITPRMVGNVQPVPGRRVASRAAASVGLPLPVRRRSLEELRDLAADGARDLADAPAAEVVAWAVRSFGPRLCVLSSMTDPVVAHLVSSVQPGVAVLFGDTGYHFAETIGTRDAIAATLPIEVVDVRPDQSVAEQAAEYGPDLYATNPDLCCRIRKTEPLRRALGGYDAWCSGIRREETATRAGALPVEWDRRRDKVKVNPIVAWSQDEVTAYIEANRLLTNPLLALGFRSIGCAPCTRLAGSDDGDPRAGRWAGNAKTECGLHL